MTTVSKIMVSVLLTPTIENNRTLKYLLFARTNPNSIYYVMFICISIEHIFPHTFLYY